MEQKSDDGSNSVVSTSGHVAVEMSIIEELDMRFGSAKNKNQIIHSLEHCAVLHRIPLSNPNATSEQARKDFRRERVLLNDVPFIPDNVDTDRCNAFSMTLNVLVNRMQRQKELFDNDLYGGTDAITDAVLQRACRTSAGADSFFMVQKLLCVEGTFVTQRTYVSDPPIKIDVFVADSEPEGVEYVSASRRLPTLPAKLNSNNSSSSGIAMDRELSGTRSPPSTPPVAKTKRSLPSPLKITLKNMGFGSKTSKHHVHAPLCASEDATFTPPGTPGGVGHSFSSSSCDIDGTINAGGIALHRSGSSNSTINTHHTHHHNHNNNNSSSNSNTGAICARIQVMNSFAIYDVAAIEEITGVASQDPDPWLEIEAIVVDESNFKTDKHWRKLQLIATCPATGKVYTSAHDASSSSRLSGRLSGRMILQELTSWLTTFPSHHHLLPHVHHHHHHHHNNSHTHNLPSNTSNNSHSGASPAAALSVDVKAQPSSSSFSTSVGRSISVSPTSSLSTTVAHSNAVSTTEGTSDSTAVHGSRHVQPGQGQGQGQGHGQGINPKSYYEHLGTGLGVSLSLPFLDLRRHSELHAAALASLQKELDTPVSGAHSLRLSSDPSPISPVSPESLLETLLEGAELLAAAAVVVAAADRDSSSRSELDEHDTDAGTAGTEGPQPQLQPHPRPHSLTGPHSVSRYEGSPLAVRTHEDLNMLIPALRLLTLPGADYNSSSSSSSDSDDDQDEDDPEDQDQDQSLDQSHSQSQDRSMSFGDEGEEEEGEEEENVWRDRGNSCDICATSSSESSSPDRDQKEEETEVVG